jgi:hypothetical protein
MHLGERIAFKEGSEAHLKKLYLKFEDNASINALVLGWKSYYGNR